MVGVLVSFHFFKNILFCFVKSVIEKHAQKNVYPICQKIQKKHKNTKTQKHIQSENRHFVSFCYLFHQLCSKHSISEHIIEFFRRDFRLTHYSHRFGFQLSTNTHIKKRKANFFCTYMFVIQTNLCINLPTRHAQTQTSNLKLSFSVKPNKKNMTFLFLFLCVFILYMHVCN